MKLRDVLRDVPLRACNADLDIEISAVVSDSRLATRGALFVAIPGFKQDGTKFIDGAAARGAVASVAQTPGHIEVDDARAALALIAANFHGRPAEKLSIIGVTGTSGKTTTARMIESIFEATGEPVGLIGTIEYRAGEERLNADRTTPDAVMLHQWFAKMVDAGVRHAVMEVSSHALALERTYGIRFAAAVFTNLSQDHFDFHGNFENYFAAKRILFNQIDCTRKTAIVNIDDQWGRRLANELGDCVISFGQNGEIRPTFKPDVRGLHGTVVTPHGNITIDSPLLGMPNLYNWLAAIGATQVVGIDAPTIERGIAALTAVRGRFEIVPSPHGGPTVIVDYAHKPDALEKLLHAVRDLAPGKKLTVLFGCGGDRDKDKRPKMGAIAAQRADFTILTSDNPRSEKPDAILDDIERGMPAGAKYVRIADRRAAIGKAIAEATANEVVVIAGKGHESYQLVGDQVLHFDDREEAEIALKNRSL